MTTKPSVGIIMGSQSDWPTLKYSANILDEFDVTYAVSYTHLTLPTKA